MVFFYEYGKEIYEAVNEFYRASGISKSISIPGAERECVRFEKKHLIIVILRMMTGLSLYILRMNAGVRHIFPSMMKAVWLTLSRFMRRANSLTKCVFYDILK